MALTVGRRSDPRYAYFVVTYDPPVQPSGTQNWQLDCAWQHQLHEIEPLPMFHALEPPGQSEAEPAHKQPAFWQHFAAACRVGDINAAIETSKDGEPGPIDHPANAS